MAVGSADRKNEFGLRSAPPAQMGIFARSGDIWTVSSSGKTFSLKDAKGLGYIQRLLQHPGEEFMHSIFLAVLAL